jgi:Tol biopolymer transport system component
MSPDERRIVVEQTYYGGSASSPLSVMNVARGTMDPLNMTMGDQKDVTVRSGGDAVWLPDSRRIAFSGNVGGETDVFVTGINPSDRPTRLKHLPGLQWAEHWSRNGKLFLYGQTESASKETVWALPLDGDRPPFLVVDSPSFSDEAQLSPDNRWLAYTSNESGRFEVYAQPFGRTGDRLRISTEGAGQPKWRADGRELFYLALDGTMMSVPFGANGQKGAARELFRVAFQPTPFLDEYAVTEDGQRFLIITPVRSDRTARLSVVSAWPALVWK